MATLKPHRNGPLSPVYSDTTELNWTQLDSVNNSWLTDSVCRSWRHKQKHDWLGCTLFNWVSWVQLSSVQFGSVELSCVAINTPLDELTDIYRSRTLCLRLRVWPCWGTKSWIWICIFGSRPTWHRSSRSSSAVTPLFYKFVSLLGLYVSCIVLWCDCTSSPVEAFLPEPPHRK